MKHVLIAGAMSAGLMLTMATAANAGARHHPDHDSYRELDPGATPRQLQNLHGYENGGYYELDSNAVPFGSRVWWELKQRAGGGH